MSGWVVLGIGVVFFLILWWFIVQIKKESEKIAKGKYTLDKNDYRRKLGGGIK